MEDSPVDLQRHLQVILEAIEELTPLSRTYAHPAPESLQFLGTIVDNTIALLMAPANAIDKGGRSITFDQPRNWLSLVQAVHRSFFASILIATEAGLAGICRERGIEVTASSMVKAAAIVERLRGQISERDAKDITGLAGKQPQFGDYLDAVVRIAGLSPADARMWRRYFRALSIVRNKASHSDVTLSNAEMIDLQQGGWAVAVSNGLLGLNPRMYKQVVEHIARFFTDVSKP